MRERKFWGWGYSDELLTDEEDKNIEQRILNNFSLSEVETIQKNGINTAIEPLIRKK